MMGDAVPQTPWDLPLLFSRMDVFRFTRNGACPTIDLLARRIGLSRDGTRAPMQVRNGGGLRAALLVSPLLHLRMDDFLSNRWGPPQAKVLKALTDFNLNAFSLFQSEEALMETMASELPSLQTWF
jgi:hypothetical protein